MITLGDFHCNLSRSSWAIQLSIMETKKVKIYFNLQQCNVCFNLTWLTLLCLNTRGNMFLIDSIQISRTRWWTGKEVLKVRYLWRRWKVRTSLIHSLYKRDQRIIRERLGWHWTVVSLQKFQKMYVTAKVKYEIQESSCCTISQFH